MRTPRLAHAVLALLLLANLLLEGGRLIAPAHAAAKSQYKIVPYDEGNREAVLNRLAAEGWEFVAVEPRYGGFIVERE